jgi:DNA-binding transcriptional ArsR family regulator
MLNHSVPLDLTFAALADPSRRDIVERLTLGPATVTELAAPLTMSLPAVLQHLRVLETSGLIRTEKTGRVRTCRIEPGALQAADRWFTARRTDLATKLDRLGDHLSSPPAPSSEEERS